MITLSHKELPPLNAKNNLLYYPKLFHEIIVPSTNMNEISKVLTMSLFLLTENMYKPKKRPLKYGDVVLIFSKSNSIVFKNGIKRINVEPDIGSVLILGSEFRHNWNYQIPENVYTMYNNNYFSGIFLDKILRIEYGEDVKNSLKHIHSLEDWNQCVYNDLIMEKIGKGCYGNVFSSKYMFNEFAIKMTAIKEHHKNYPYNVSYSSWHDVYYMDKLIRPLIEKNISPNLPLLYDYFTCKKCKIDYKEETDNKTRSCIITILEKANGTLKDYFQQKRTEKELHSILFQLMACLHAIQYNYQIMHFDIKKENVLYYNVEPGGFWKYTIKGVDYYVPNFGTMIVLNDFGIARTLSPDYPVYKSKSETFRLGYRCAININGRFSPFDSLGSNQKLITWDNSESSYSEQFEMERDKTVLAPKIKLSEEQKKFLNEKNIPTDPTNINFFLFPEIIPPFEFYNDTQDVIRLFIGGKRTTQKGHHSKYKYITKRMFSSLEKYNGSSESSSSKFFSIKTNQVLASAFIQDFFPHYKTEKYDIIDSYIIS